MELLVHCYNSLVTSNWHSLEHSLAMDTIVPWSISPKEYIFFLFYTGVHNTQNGNYWVNNYRVLSWLKIVIKYILNTKAEGRNMAMFLGKKKTFWVEIWCILTHGIVSCSWKSEKGLWQKYFKYFIYRCPKCCPKMIKSVLFLDINCIFFIPSFS